MFGFVETRVFVAAADALLRRRFSRRRWFSRSSAACGFFRGAHNQRQAAVIGEKMPLLESLDFTFGLSLIESLHEHSLIFIYIYMI